MAKKPANLLSGLSSSKTRTFVILFGVIIFIGILIAYLRRDKGPEDVLAKQSSQALAVPADIRATPGSVAPEKQRELIMQENEKRAQEALKTKSSAIPTIIGAITNPNDKNSVDAAAIDAATKNQERDKLGRLGLGDAGGSGFAGGGAFGANGLNGAGGAGAGGVGGAGGAGAGGAFGAGGAGGAFGAGGAGGAGGAFGANGEGGFGKSAADRARELQEQRLREQRELLEKQRAEQERLKELERQRRLAEQQQREYEASVTKIANQMKTYAGTAYQDWSKFPNQAYVQGQLAGKTFTPQSTDSGTSTTRNSSSASPQATRLGNVRPSPRKVIIKAGTILFGVLDTAVNTDEPGPILATIVSGKYNGGKLIGTFTHQAQQTTVTMSFNQMTVPKRAKSFGVSVVAIDPDTARTALATDFDRHLLQRYGTLFASSFIQGYGQAITQQGTTTTSPLTGTTTTTTPPLDNKQIFYAALGELGKQWSQAIKPYFNTPYTVTVDQGTSVGLLFLSDIDVSDDE